MLFCTIWGDIHFSAVHRPGRATCMADDMSRSLYDDILSSVVHSPGGANNKADVISRSINDDIHLIAAYIIQEELAVWLMTCNEFTCCTQSRRT